MNKHLLKAGDPVEVRFTTHDGYIWKYARVIFVDDQSISVEHRGGFREGFLHDDGRLRVPKSTQPIGTTHQPSPLKTTRV